MGNPLEPTGPPWAEVEKLAVGASGVSSSAGVRGENPRVTRDGNGTACLFCGCSKRVVLQHSVLLNEPGAPYEPNDPEGDQLPVQVALPGGFSPLATFILATALWRMSITFSRSGTAMCKSCSSDSERRRTTFRTCCTCASSMGLLPAEADWITQTSARIVARSSASVGMTGCISTQRRGSG